MKELQDFMEHAKNGKRPTKRDIFTFFSKMSTIHEDGITFDYDHPYFSLCVSCSSFFRNVRSYKLSYVLLFQRLCANNHTNQ